MIEIVRRGSIFFEIDELGIVRAEVAASDRSGVRSSVEHRTTAQLLRQQRCEPWRSGRHHVEVQPELLPALKRLVAPATRGDPESGLRWSAKTAVALSREMFGAHAHGIRVSLVVAAFGFP
jgi:hypothetical protein